MKILITGDLVVDQLFDNSNINEDMITLFKQSDLNIVNLEAPVTTSNSKILKTGPHLKSHKQRTLNVLNALKVDVVTMANNHILDYDEQGVIDTLDFCQKNNFQTVGAGRNLTEASKTLFIDTPEGKIAIVNFAENEWASATEETAGANPMNIIDNVYQIKDAKNKSNFVFVVVHGGHEYYNLPSPRMQKQYRFYAEQGADIVIGHHTHCINGHELYNGVPIYYSLANFLFTKSSTYEDWYLGLVLEVEIKKGKIIPQLHPVKQKKETYKLSLLDRLDKQEVFNRISEYNIIISDSKKLKCEWDKYVEFKYVSYLNHLSPTSFIRHYYVKALFNKIGLRLLNKQAIAYTLNLMRCEAHSDLSKDVIQKYLKK
ncbi:CapA family protein [Polaribacter sp. IC063]|uniref:CapA family protein n=1 Tax=Polaribacter sp. IC063 TaxID=57031 RepID=UPI0011BE49C9|nr:CapA family protein [Polaribacter sp. IC063]TXD51436.1 CapA family protein [Polaribacter sp. IC063]